MWKINKENSKETLWKGGRLRENKREKRKSWGKEWGVIKTAWKW